jgi:cell wall-associated NlpC family hydrolase
MEHRLSPLSGVISPAYRQVLPEMMFRASASEVSADASYSQIYYWSLRPLGFESLRPGDLVFFSDGSAPVTGAGLFAGWRGQDELRVLTADHSTGSLSYINWDLQENTGNRRLIAVGRLFIAAAPRFD